MKPRIKLRLRSKCQRIIQKVENSREWYLCDFHTNHFLRFSRIFFSIFYRKLSLNMAPLFLPIVLFKILNSILFCNNYLTIWLFWTTAGKLNQTLIRRFNSDKPVLTEWYKSQPRYFIDNFNRKWTGWPRFKVNFKIKVTRP